MRHNPTIKDSLRDDPVAFVTRLLHNPDGKPSEPHPGQVDLLRALVGKKDSVIVTGRQWGKSIAMGWYIAWWMLRYPHRHVRIFAPTLDQARIIFNEVARMFHEYPLNSMLAKKIVDFPFPNITLTNGTQCHARGANSPEYIRGQPTHLAVVDESAYVKDGVFPNVIQPLFTVTGKVEGNGIIRISTPFGQGDFFDGAMAAQRDTTGTKTYKHFTSLENPYADIDALLAIRDYYGEDSLIWQSEYLGNFSASDMAVFNAQDIRWAYENYPGYDAHGSLKNYPQLALPGHRYTQGADLANRTDYFVSVMLDATDSSSIVQSRHDRFQQKGYAFYKDIIRRNYNTYNRGRTLVDATSLGESVVEDLRDIGAEGYKFTSQSKYDLVHNLVRMLNQHQVKIPFIRELVDELKYFQYEITPSKNVKMEARQGHDDYVIALALSGQLASQPMFRGFFQAVDLELHPTRLPDDYDPFKDDE